ncbi:hypothetical protein [Nostoc mirabile]|nr:hypothetical protein [Nostoc mirabile]
MIASFWQEVDKRLGKFATSLEQGESKSGYETIRDRTLFVATQ